MLTRILIKNSVYFTKTRNFDTIYALATGVGSAVSVVRIGGPQAYRALEILNESKIRFNENRQTLLKKYRIEPRKAHFKTIYTQSGKIIDKCLMLYFPAPHSYNSQQILEFHLHGSKAVVASLFSELKSKGFRMADRGQFTKRALLNGKLTVVQAQSIDDLIKSESEFERQIAINNMLGKSKQFLDTIKEDLVKCLANNEAYIDFQEDEVSY